MTAQRHPTRAGISTNPHTFTVDREHLDFSELATYDGLLEAAKVFWARGCIDSGVWKQLRLYQEVARLRAGR